MKDFKDISKHLSDLPKREAPEDLWVGISHKLETASTPLDKILPIHEAPNELWEGIASQLNSRIPFYKKPWLAVAASIIIILGITFMLKIQAPQTNIIVADEYLSERPSNSGNLDLKLNVTEYCSQFPTVCSSEKFTTLKAQFENLKQRKDQLISMKNFDADPDINIYIERINLELTTIERQLIAMF